MENNKETNDSKDKEEDINALSDNKVDVEIEPDVKANKVNIQLCSCSFILNCFTNTKPSEKN
jgi:hypothetical protein